MPGEALKAGSAALISLALFHVRRFGIILERPQGVSRIDQAHHAGHHCVGGCANHLHNRVGCVREREVARLFLRRAEVEFAPLRQLRGVQLSVRLLQPL